SPGASWEGSGSPGGSPKNGSHSPPHGVLSVGPTMRSSNPRALAVEAARAGDLKAFATLVEATQGQVCRRAWSLDVMRSDQWVEVMAWGEYADWVLRGIGADPERQTALG